MISRSNGRIGVAALVTILATGATVACFEPSSAPADTQAPRASANREAAGVGDEVGKLRAVTEKFHDIEKATDAGYTIALTGCYRDELGGRGAMGYHFGKGSALDATVNPLEPEALLYEPEKNGRMRLVGVEFIVPFSAVSADSPAPRAFGLEFKQNFVFNVWALHVWLWKNNPSGIFADWNPNVSCEFAAPASASVSHAH